MTRLLTLAALMPSAALAHDDVVPHVHAGGTVLTPVIAVFAAAAVGYAAWMVWGRGGR